MGELLFQNVKDGFGLSFEAGDELQLCLVIAEERARLLYAIGILLACCVRSSTKLYNYRL